MAASKDEHRAVPAGAIRDGAKSLFRQVFGSFATGVTVVSTTVRGRAFGMTANAFMAGSLEPPLCVVSVSRAAAFHHRVTEARRFAVSILSQEQRQLADHFAGRRLPGSMPALAEHEGLHVVPHAVAIVIATVVDTADCGDHTLFIGAIDSMAVTGSARPLVFFGGNYRQIERDPSIEEVYPALFW